MVVIGGVAAGASAAARARRLDEQAEIIILERSQHVSFANCGLPYHISGVIEDRERLLLQTPESLQAILDLDVRVGHEVLEINRAGKAVKVRELATGREYSESYEKLVLCPGASPIRPPIPGVDLDQVFVLRNVEDMDQIKAAVDSGARRATVIGGGYIGVEMAENLRERGLEVDLVEMMDQIMPPLDREMARDLENHMRWHGVRLHLGTAAAAIRRRGDNLSVELGDGTLVESDLVILSAGVRPETGLAKDAELELGPRGGILVDEHMRTSDPDIYAAGDAVEVIDAVTGQPALIPLAGPANRQGRTVSDSICGRDSTYIATQGTAIVKVFDMTGGGTGASEKTLAKAGVPFRKAYLHPSGHAGYYPGTAPMHLKILFAPEDGRVLGGQCVGYDGVDKRIDVLATAIRAGMTVHDLQHLELAYAPPFGSAKDPVNMAGFVGANMLKGDIEIWFAEDYPDKTGKGLIVDVRSEQEYEIWHIPGAVNVPLGELRASIDQLPTDKPLFLYCKVGFRSYLAYRLLKQRGFAQVQTLSGGTLTFCGYHGTSVCTGRPEPAVLSYAEERMVDPPPQASPGRTVDLDCTGLQCPGPLRRVSEAMEELNQGDELAASATDPGFPTDIVAWCRQRGHEVVDTQQQSGRFTVRMRKGGGRMTHTAGAAPAPVSDKKTMVVFSGDLDKVLAAFVIANGALAMGSEVTLFFTFWGLNALRKTEAPPVRKSFLDRMFGMMMPRGAARLKLSKMNMGGAGTAMMKHVMKQKNVESLPDLMAAARKGGVKIVACSMSMDVMGITREELVDGIEVGGVAAFLGESADAGMTLFI
jgi:NADPH-dependent 2,4-dienoyl-CoA reductase/sulfur reductase-like enzyme/peroxiredoxin family protein/rhodanese-related sulfurtransferase/TusA-related sulfurtransferase